MQKKKKTKQKKQQNDSSIINNINKEMDGEKELTKDIIDQNRRWALEKTRKKKYTSD